MEEKVRFRNPEYWQNPPKAPESDKKIYAMKNGEIFLQEHVNVSINDLGFTRGLTVFTVMEARGNVIFHLDDHIERLRNSAISAYISPGNFDTETWTIYLRNQIKRLLKLNGFRESVVKIYMTGGLPQKGFLPQGAPTTYIIVEDKNAYPVKESVRLGVMEFERYLPLVKKTDDYFPAIIEMARFNEQDIELDDMLYLARRGTTYWLLECSRANIFILTRDNELLTPHSNMLPGVTRNIVLKLAKNRKDLLSVQERDVSFSSLVPRIVKEIFITSTTKGIVSVVLIESSFMSERKEFEIGEFTLSLKQDFNNYREEYYKGH